MKDLKSVLSNFNFDVKVKWHLELNKKFPEIFAQLTKHTKINKIYNDTLILEVYETSWLQELYMLSNIILKRLRVDFPQINKIKFIRSRRKFRKKLENKLIKNIISNKEIKAVEKIKDKDLAKSLLSYYQICLSK